MLPLASWTQFGAMQVEAADERMESHHRFHVKSVVGNYPRFVSHFCGTRTQYRRLDLNQWPSPFQRDALPPELHRYQTEPTVGLEPTPFALRKRCSTN